MLNRRKLLLGFAAAPFGLAAAAPSQAQTTRLENVQLRGGMDGTSFGLSPRNLDDQSKAFQDMLNAASEREIPIYLPAGNYIISNITLPKNVRLIGVPGATRILYRGNGFLFQGADNDRVILRDLVIDGLNRSMDDNNGGLIQLQDVAQILIENCDIVGAAHNGIWLARCAGKIISSRFSGHGNVAIFSVNGRAMEISGNVIQDCGDGGILVHRWEIGEDGTIVASNRISRIRADNGGTGQVGNGINIFRAGNVMVMNNVVSDCAFSAVRTNSASNIQIIGNSCVRSGETGIYAEFSFEGAVINGNIVDGATNGISVVNYNEGGRLATVSGNIVRNLKTSGPYEGLGEVFGVGIAVEADTSVTGNVVENAPVAGMSLGWGDYLRSVNVNGNVVRQSGVGIIVTVVEGTGKAIITNNLFEGTPKGAVVGNRWHDTVTKDLTINNDQDHLLIANNQQS